MRKQAIFLALTIITAAATALAADWPQFRGPNRSGVAAEGGLITAWPAEGPKMLWSYKGLGAGFASVSVVDGLIYTTGVEDKSEYVYAFDLNGQLKWKRTVVPAGPANTPAAAPPPQSTATASTS